MGKISIYKQRKSKLKDETLNPHYFQENLSRRPRKTNTSSLKVKASFSHTNEQREVKVEAIAASLEENIEEALRNGHLGTPVDADFLHLDDHIQVNRKTEHVDENAFSNSINNDISSGTEEHKPKKCPLCTFIYTKSESLELHKVIHAGKPPYKCEECNCSQPTTSSFNYHILLHTKDSPHMCPHCDHAPYYKSQYLNEHIKSYHPRTTIKCDQCSFTALYPSQIQKHKSKNHSSYDEKTENAVYKGIWCSVQIGSKDNPKKCPMCTFVYTKSESLELHKVIHAGKPPYKCEECNCSQPTTSSFNYHILLHTKDSPHMCPHCDHAPYSKSQYLNEHIKSHHPRTTIKCDQCSFTAPYPNHIHKHKSNIHPTYEKITINQSQSFKISQCKHCRFLYTKDVSLAEHNQVHELDPPYQCPYCTYSAISPGHFSEHILIHTQDKPYQCPHCEYSSTSDSSLLSHIKRLHKNIFISCDSCDFKTWKPADLRKHQENHLARPCRTVLRCERCNFIYTESDSLKLHKRVHSGKAPYQCSLCRFKSDHASDYNRHILTHSLDKPFFCDQCLHCSRSSSELNRHIKLVHGELQQ